MAQYEQIRETEKRYCSIAMTIAVFAGLALILLSMKPMGKGLILGTLFSVLNFIIIGETLPKKLGASRKRATILSGGSIVIRYGMLAIPLALAIKLETFHIVATIIGLFMIQVLILSDQVVKVILNPSTRNNRIIE